LPGWKGQFWKRNPDLFSILPDSAEIIYPPGTQFVYIGPSYAMLAYVITASLKNSPQTDIYTLLKERIMGPIGVPDNEWSISYNNTPYNVNGMKIYAIWGGGKYTARSIAKIGRLMLHKGNWEGKQLVASSCVEKIVSYAGFPLPDRSTRHPNPASGLCWWTNIDGVFSSLPRDAYIGAGAGSQVLLIVPSLDLIVVRLGDSLNEDKGFWDLLRKYIFKLNLVFTGENSFRHACNWHVTEKYIFNQIMKSIEK
jgi:CubicO group peptidase (beta-lactamase class C family)